METSAEQRAAFGAALRRQLEGKPRARFAADVADLSGETVSENAIHLWLKGSSEPSRTKVFAMERVLGVDPGALSRHLGYVPAATKENDGTPSAIANDTRLDETGRRAMLALYRELIRD